MNNTEWTLGLKVLLALLLSIAILGGGIYAYQQRFNQLDPPGVQQPNTPETPSDPSTTLEGESVCLPLKDKTGPSTMECALGIKVGDKHYALSGVTPDDTFKLNGSRIKAIGMLMPPGNYQSKYEVTGTLKVQSITKL